MEGEGEALAESETGEAEVRAGQWGSNKEKKSDQDGKDDSDAEVEPFPNLLLLKYHSGEAYDFVFRTLQAWV